ncbi:MAG: IGHMBP2 family helicase, partial [Chryseotalea sp.]
MNSIEELRHTYELLKKEKEEDLLQYQQKVLRQSICEKKKSGICWYPVKLDRSYIGTGERLIVELQRTNSFEQKHLFQAGRAVSFFSNAQQKPTRDHVNAVVNYVRDNQMV